MRTLNHIEQAFTDSNEINPLCVVIVLRLQTGPRPEDFRRALDELQRRHLLLRCGISTDRTPYRFRPMDPVSSIPLEVVVRSGAVHWERVTEDALNTRFDPSGPLMRTVYLRGASEESEFVLVLHHAVMDGTSARLLLHEILRLSGGLSLEDPLPESDQIRSYGFPSQYSGVSLGMKLGTFMARQVRDELVFARKGLGVRPASDPHNKILHLQLPAGVSRRLNVRTGRGGISLNAVLNAALLRAVLRTLHPEHEQGAEKIMRAILFVDLRPSLLPPPNEAVLGCMISMLRVATVVRPADTLVDIANHLKRQIFLSAKSGEPFLASVMARPMVKLAFKARRGRIGNAAVSFLGKLDLESQYGSTELVDVHAFITNNVVGPELSAFAKILFGRIELDLTYLSSEISTEQARELLAEVEVSLHDLAG